MRQRPSNTGPGRIRLASGSGWAMPAVPGSKSSAWRRRENTGSSWSGPPPSFTFPQHPKAPMVLLLESAGDPASLAAPLRDTMRDLDPDLPTFGTRTLQQTFETGAVDPNLLIVQMSAAMGSMGVLLALSGLYG